MDVQGFVIKVGVEVLSRLATTKPVFPTSSSFSPHQLSEHFCPEPQLYPLSSQLNSLMPNQALFTEIYCINSSSMATFSPDRYAVLKCVTNISTMIFTLNSLAQDLLDCIISKTEKLHTNLIPISRHWLCKCFSFH